MIMLSFKEELYHSYKIIIYIFVLYFYYTLKKQTAPNP